jgi:hypothetical protein
MIVPGDADPGLRVCAQAWADDLREAGLEISSADVLDASRDAGNRWVFSESTEAPWTGVRLVAFAGSPHATHYVDLGASLERGIASLREHATYLAGLGVAFDPDEFLRGNARRAGEEVGCDYATTFEVYEF